MFEILHEEPFGAEARKAAIYLDAHAPADGWGIPELEGRPVSVLLCGERTSASLNKAQRGLDKPTDVLSWSYCGEGSGDWPATHGEDGGPAGEIAVCMPVCVRQARLNGWELEVELVRLLVHGVAHILGYGHDTPGDEKRMIAFETALLAKAGLRGVYPDG